MGLVLVILIEWKSHTKTFQLTNKTTLLGKGMWVVHIGTTPVVMATVLPAAHTRQGCQSAGHGRA